MNPDCGDKGSNDIQEVIELVPPETYILFNDTSYNSTVTSYSGIQSSSSTSSITIGKPESKIVDVNNAIKNYTFVSPNDCASTSYSVSEQPFLHYDKPYIILKRLRKIKKGHKFVQTHLQQETGSTFENFYQKIGKKPHRSSRRGKFWYRPYYMFSQKHNQIMFAPEITMMLSNGLNDNNCNSSNGIVRYSEKHLFDAVFNDSVGCNATNNCSNSVNTMNGSQNWELWKSVKKVLRNVIANVGQPQTVSETKIMFDSESEIAVTMRHVSTNTEITVNNHYNTSYVNKIHKYVTVTNDCSYVTTNSTVSAVINNCTNANERSRKVIDNAEVINDHCDITNDTVLMVDNTNNVTNNSGIQSSSSTSSITINNPESKIVDVNNAIKNYTFVSPNDCASTSYSVVSEQPFLHYYKPYIILKNLRKIKKIKIKKKHRIIQTNIEQETDSTFENFYGRIRKEPPKTYQHSLIWNRPYYMFSQKYNRLMFAPETTMMLSNGPNEIDFTEDESFTHRAETGIENCNSPNGIVRYSEKHLFDAVFNDNVGCNATNNCLNSVNPMNGSQNWELWKSVKKVLRNVIANVSQPQTVSETKIMFDSESEIAVTMRHVSTNTEITVNNHYNTSYVNKIHKYATVTNDCSYVTTNSTVSAVINNCTNANERSRKVIDNAEVINDHCDITNDTALMVDNTNNVTNNSGIQSSSSTSSITIDNPESKIVDVNNAIKNYTFVSPNDCASTSYSVVSEQPFLHYYKPYNILKNLRKIKKIKIKKKHRIIQTNIQQEIDSTFENFYGRIRKKPPKKRQRSRIWNRPYYMFSQKYNRIMFAPETTMMLSNGPNEIDFTEDEYFTHRTETGIENCDSPNGIVRYSEKHLFKAVFNDNVGCNATKNCLNSVNPMNGSQNWELWKSVQEVLKNIIEKVDWMVPTVSETKIMFDSKSEIAVTVRNVSTNTEITDNNHYNTSYVNKIHKFVTVTNDCSYVTTNSTVSAVVNNCTNTNERRRKIIDNTEVINNHCDITNDTVLMVDNTNNDIIVTKRTKIIENAEVIYDHCDITNDTVLTVDTTNNDIDMNRSKIIDNAEVINDHCDITNDTVLTVDTTNNDIDMNRSKIIDNAEVINDHCDITNDTIVTVDTTNNDIDMKRSKIIDNAEVINDHCDITNDSVLMVDNISNDIITVADSVSYSNSVLKINPFSVNGTKVSVKNYNIRKSSSVSVNATTSKVEIMTPTISRNRLNRRKRRQKTQQNISKLFNHLRDVSQKASRTSLSNSVISLDDTQNTVIDLDNPKECTSNIAESSMIIIPDDDIQTNACSTPKQKISLHHSTPKSQSQSKLDDLIITRSNNNHSLQNLNENVNITKEINSDSYLTIDLTTESANKTEPTVIDLDNTTDHDCSIVAPSTSNISSMSGDSDVTVLRQPMNRKLKKFTNGIASLNATEKGKLLELITQTIFNGCNVPANVKSTMNIRKSLPRVPDTAEDTYIKDVIIGGKASRCSIGSNVYHPDRKSVNKTGRRMVVIDGSNVAMEHGRGQHFSVRGLQICIDYFLRRGHVVKAFVPRFRCKNGMSTDGRLLDFLERRGLVIYTPSRQVNGRTITPYDDRYIIQCAAEFDAVIVSGDNYRDLIDENPRWRNVIEKRLLPFTWVNDMIMFPKDPLGRYGPTLETFLKY